MSLRLSVLILFGLFLMPDPVPAQELPSTCEAFTETRQCSGRLEPLGLSQTAMDCRVLCERLSASCCQFANLYCKASFENEDTEPVLEGVAAACSPYRIPERSERLKRWDR